MSLKRKRRNSWYYPDKMFVIFYSQLSRELWTESCLVVEMHFKIQASYQHKNISYVQDRYIAVCDIWSRLWYMELSVTYGAVCDIWSRLWHIEPSVIYGDTLWCDLKKCLLLICVLLSNMYRVRSSVWLSCVHSSFGGLWQFLLS